MRCGESGYFDDTATTAMGIAFDRACGSRGWSPIVRETIANGIVAIAQQGERDPVELHDQALKVLGIIPTRLAA
jgi:hypothetical protein